MAIISKVTKKHRHYNARIVVVPKKLLDLGMIQVDQVYEAEERNGSLEYRYTGNPFEKKNKWMSAIKQDAAGQAFLTIYARIARAYMLAEVAEWNVEDGRAVMRVAAEQKK